MTIYDANNVKVEMTEYANPEDKDEYVRYTYDKEGNVLTEEKFVDGKKQ